MGRQLLWERLRLFGLDLLIQSALKFLDSCRYSSGGYASRTPEDRPAAATTAIICIARKKAGVIGEPLDAMTQEDLEFLLGKFNDVSNSWGIFRSEVPSAWPTAFSIWALSILGMGRDLRVKAAVESLLSWQSGGGWGVTSRNDNEILISYVATRSLIAYYLNVDKDLRIKNALESSAEYFSRNLNKEIENLNITDCALAFQGLDDIYSSSIITPLRLDPLRGKVLAHLHNLISTGGYLDTNRIIRKVGSAEWYIDSFHPAVLPIISRHGGDPLDLYVLLNWFTTNFEVGGDVGRWRHFANEDSTYPTALAVYAICDLFNNANALDICKGLQSKILTLDEENQQLKSVHHKINRLLLAWQALRDSKTASAISNYSQVIIIVIAVASVLFLWLTGLYNSIINWFH